MKKYRSYKHPRKFNLKSWNKCKKYPNIWDKYLLKDKSQNRDNYKDPSPFNWSRLKQVKHKVDSINIR